MYQVRYNNSRVSDEHVIVIDNLFGLINVTCDIDQTALFMQFIDAYSLMDFVNALEYVSDYLTGGQSHGCAPRNSTSNSTDNYLLRRVISGEYNEMLGQIQLVATEAKYDEIYQTADIQFATYGSCADSFDAPICIGVNTENSCDSATSPITIFQNQYVDITCSNCFLGFITDVFLDLHIELFKLKSLTGGFKNMSLNGGLVFDLNAHDSWSTGVDKTLNFIPPTTAISFWIGPIPFKITFAVPVQVIAQANFQATAQATIGATAEWNIGDNYIMYTAGQGWTHVTPDPEFTWTPQAEGSAEFHADASFALVPSLEMSVDNVYDYQLQLYPILNFQAEGSTKEKQLCANLTYDVEIDSSAQLHINIPWLFIHDTDSYGPRIIYNTGTKPIGGICVNAL